MPDPIITTAVTSFVGGFAAEAGRDLYDKVKNDDEGWERHDQSIEDASKSIREGWERHDTAIKGEEWENA